MENKSPYMKIDMLGNIYIKDTIVFYDIPLMFTCSDDIGNTYIANCINLDSEEKWLFVKTSNRRLRKIMSGKIYADDIFRKPEEDQIFEVAFENYSCGKARKRRPNTLDDSELPEKRIKLCKNKVEVIIITPNEYLVNVTPIKKSRYRLRLLRKNSKAAGLKHTLLPEVKIVATMPSRKKRKREIAAIVPILKK